MFRSRLARRVSLWVFSSVVAIEIVILVPSYYRRQQELSQQQFTTVERALLPMLQQMDSPESLRKKLQQQYEMDQEITGILLYQAGEEKFRLAREEFIAQPVAGNVARSIKYVTLNRTEVAWSVMTQSGEYTLLLRLNTQSVQQELVAYTLRIIGLIILISAVVTVTTMYTVTQLIIGPLLQLRQRLLEAADELSNQLHGATQTLPMSVPRQNRSDELGDLFQAFDQLLQRTQTEIADRYEAQASLEREIQQTQAAQQQSEELQQVLRELRDTQVQLIHSEKMSSLGQLVAGVAHEFNNPVSFIHCNLMPLREYMQQVLQLLQSYQVHYPEPPFALQELSEAIDIEYIESDLPRLVTSMETGTHRICQIVDSLRNFSRLDESEWKQVDIHQGIDSALLLLQHRLDEVSPRIKVRKQYGDLPMVECCANQMNQVFLSILSNAIDAIVEQGESGLVHIQTCRLPDDRVQIMMTDNGSGIATEVMPQIFDPFFTTKAVGQGAGLGLSVSYQIVQRHGGTLVCPTRPDGKTSFIIEIPVCQGDDCAVSLAPLQFDEVPASVAMNSR